MRRLAMVTILVCAAGSAAAADDGMLKRMVGDWIGQGMVRLKADEEPQRLYCKITGALAPDGRSLRESGRCALPELSVAIEAVVEAVGSGRYRGSGGRRGNPPAATFSGSAKSDRLVLIADTDDGEEKNKATATVEVGDDGFRVRAVAVNRKTNATYTVTDVIFRHR
jgi:hypothetical protein